MKSHWVNGATADALLPSAAEGAPRNSSLNVRGTLVPSGSRSHLSAARFPRQTRRTGSQSFKTVAGGASAPERLFGPDDASESLQGRVPGGLRGRRRVPGMMAQAVSQDGPATESEREMWLKRKEESEKAAEEEGTDLSALGSIDEWRWTLNWDPISPEMLVGSCPRSAGDVDRLAKEAQITAILNLQSDLCFDALKIPFEEIKQRAVEQGVCLVRVPIRDFDHGDQTLMLPEAVRVLNLLIHRGHRVYIHCTAGINRANLVAVAYLYYIQGLRRDEAARLVKDSRPIANPYMDCLMESKRRLLEGRDEELTALATEIYEQRVTGSMNGDASTDWSGAQTTAIARTFRKYLEVDQGFLDMERDILRAKWKREHAGGALENSLQACLENAKALVDEQKKKIAQLRAMALEWEKEEAAAQARAAELEAALKQELGMRSDGNRVATRVAPTKLL